MSKRKILSLPEDCPAWLAEWIGGMDEWQQSVNNKLEQILANGKRNNPGIVTWKDLAKSILLPLLLAINTAVLAVILKQLIGGAAP